LNLGLDIVNLGLHVVDGVGLPCVKGDLFTVKGAVIQALVISPGKTIKVPLHFSHSIHTKTEPSPEPDPMEEVNEASLEHFVEST
jgi:hypothetical protein